MTGVAKGSFFNNFADKRAFAEAIATEVRLELEDQIARANADVADPVERIAGGMRVGAAFALGNPKRTVVLLRSHGRSTARNHPLNKGVLGDFEAPCARGLLRPEAKVSGVLYWLGLCQALMANLVERRFAEAEADGRVADMIMLGLSGLGVSADEAARHAGRALLRAGR